MNRMRLLLEKLPRLSRRGRMMRNFAAAAVLAGALWLSFGMPGITAIEGRIDDRLTVLDPRTN